jgi:hypothetical protein
LRAVNPENVLRQAAATQLLAQLFRGQFMIVIDLAVKMGIDLERQQAAQEAQIGPRFIERNECEIADQAVLSRRLTEPGTMSPCLSRFNFGKPTISAARIPASFSIRLILLGTPAGRPIRRSPGSNGVSSPPLAPGIVRIFFTYFIASTLVQATA